MSRHICSDSGVEIPDSDEVIAERLAEGRFFWLDLHVESHHDMDLLSEVFAFHPLAIEDARRFGQRPKVEEYDDFLYLVVYGAAAPPDEDGLVELHCFYSERFLVTVRREQSEELEGLRRRVATRPELAAKGTFFLHQALDVAVDSFFPALDRIDAEVDALEGELLGDDPPHDAQRRIFAVRRRMSAIRRVVLPEREELARLVTGAVTVPGMGPEEQRYFRDIEDHLIRIAQTIDGYREVLAALTDVHLSSVSNRLGVITKQLTVIAGIFLPLTFVTGFFGQNFPWMVDHIGGPGWFFVLAVGLQLMVVALLLVLFHRRGWL